MRTLLSRFALSAAALIGVSAPAAAQVLEVSIEFGGDLAEEDRAAFDDALHDGIRAVAPDAWTQAETEAAIGEALMRCQDRDCAITIGETTPASVVVAADIYAEAEIYDFTVRVYRASDGDTLVTQLGDCTFCPVAEAVERFAETCEAAIAAAEPLPAPTTGPVVEPEPEPEPTPEPTPPVSTGPQPYVQGNIPFYVSVVPETAEVLINGEVVGEGRAGLQLAPQDLAFEFRADGHETYTEDVTLTDGMDGPIFLRVVLQQEPEIVTVEVPVEVPVEVLVEAPGEPAARAPRAPSEASFNRRAVGGVLIGTGIVATAGGAVLLALDGNTTCTNGPPELCEDVWEFTAGGGTLVGIGGLSIGTGIGLLISAARDDAVAATPRTDVSLAPLRRGGAVLLRRNF